MFKTIYRVILMVLYLLASLMGLCLIAVSLYFIPDYLSLDSVHSVVGMSMCVSVGITGIGTDIILYKTFRELGAI